MSEKQSFQVFYILLLLSQGEALCKPEESGMKFTVTPRTSIAVRPGESVSFYWQWMLKSYSMSDIEEVIFIKGINRDRNKLLTIRKTGDKRWNSPRKLSCNTPPQTRVNGTWNRSSSALFTLYNVQHCDSGIYVLELDLGLVAGVRINCVKLVVTDKVVRITEKAGLATVKEGQKVVLECSVTGSRPVQITWVRDNVILQIRTYMENSSYVIHNVGLGDEGIYTCKATNSEGEDEYQIQLAIKKYKPKIIRMEHDQKILANIRQKVNLICNASGNPPPKFRWFHNGLLVEDNTITNHDIGVLQPRLRSTSDFGVYTCQAENTEGKDTVNFTVSEIGNIKTVQAVEPMTGPVETVLKSQSTNREVESMVLWFVLGLVSAIVVTVAARSILTRIRKEMNLRKGRSQRRRALSEVHEMRRMEIMRNQERNNMTMMAYWQVVDSPGSHQAQAKSLPLSKEGSKPNVVNGEKENENSYIDEAYALNKTSGSSARRFECPRGNIDIKRIIGEGANGLVAEGTLKRGKTISVVAVKMLKAQFTPNERKDLLTELHLMMNLKPHKHVIKLLACVTTSEPIFVITEYAPFGDLLGFLRKRRGLQDGYYNTVNIPTTGITQKELLSFAWQVADGMTYLASKQIVHRDLAARNVLVGENQTCKLTDFGMARDIHQENMYKIQSGKRIPVKWTALESLLMGEYTTESDVWSYGVLLYEVFTLGEDPYHEIGSHQATYLIRKLQSGYRMCKPKHIANEIYLLMSECWKENPKTRPTFQSICGIIKNMQKHDQIYINLNEYDNNLYVNLEGN